MKAPGTERSASAILRPRLYQAADRDAVLDLWQRAGGWHRATTPLVRRDVESALGRLERRARRLWWGRPPPSREMLWVEPAEGRTLEGMVYARFDEEEGGFGSPIHLPDSSESDHVRSLLETASGWILERGDANFLVEVPRERPTLRALVAPRGVLLWSRSILERAAPAAPEEGADGHVHAFRPMHRRAVVELFRKRYPAGPLPQVPVPFLEPETPGWWGAGRGRKRSHILIYLEDERLRGVVGTTTDSASSVVHLGPYFLDPALPPEAGATLLHAAFLRLGPAPGRRYRISLPLGTEPESESLRQAGFEEVARGDLFRVRA